MSEIGQRWSRRLFIGGGAVVAAAAALYVGAVGRGALKACGYNPAEAGLTGDLRALIRIGNSYLKQQDKAEELRALDTTFFDEREADIAAAVQRHLLTMDGQAQSEFASAETVSCDGWVLAKSEAQFCAMLALRAQRFHSPKDINR